VDSHDESASTGARVTQLTSRQRSYALLVCCVAVLLIGIDLTAVNVALPTIGREFHANVASLSWTIDAYALTLASLLMLSSSTADKVGRKRVFQLGLVTFIAGSLLCALSPNLAWLVVFRVIQGIGGSMLTPVAISIIANIYPNSAERGRALGIWSGVTGLALALGPVVGGALVGSSLGWRWIFAINLPIGVVALFMTQRFIPESRSEHPRRLDALGQLFVIITLSSLIFGIIEGPRFGWASLEIIACFVVTVIGVASIMYYEPRRFQPLLELRFFKGVPFTSANVIAIASFAALASFLLVNSLYLQEGRHFSPLHAGLLILPLAVASIIFGPINGRILARFGARASFVIAGVALTVAGLMLTRESPTTSVWWLLSAYGFMGIGNSAVGAPITHTAVAGMPVAQLGVASGINSTTRQIGSALGVAIAGATLASATHRDFASSTHMAWWISTGYGVMVLVLGIVSTTEWAKSTAKRINFGEHPGARRHMPSTSD
jgi:EmrB/QacA subfamily drug resistance transporter